MVISTDRTIEDIYPLSPMQQGMLFHSLLAPNTNAYFEQFCATIHGDLDVGIFEASWRRIIERHSSLRSSFIWEDIDEPLQIIQRNQEFDFRILDWSEYTDQENVERLQGFLTEDKSKSFDFSKSPLMRLTLIRVSDKIYKFIWSFHHILLDGWSVPILLKEVFFIYEAGLAGKPAYLPPLRPYRDYIRWLKNQNLQEAETYWRNYLRGFETPTPIVIDTIPKLRLPINDQTIRKSRLPLAISESLRSFAKENGLTLSTIMQGAWALLLHQYNEENEVCFGTTVSGRPGELPGSENMVGLFINTLPLRIKFNDQELINWLKEIQMEGVLNRKYEYAPLFQIQNWSGCAQGTPLFESILVFENYPVDSALSEFTGSLNVSDIKHSAATNYPLTLIVAPGNEIEIQISYDPKRIDGDAVQRVLQQLGEILVLFLEDAQLGVKSISELFNQRVSGNIDEDSTLSSNELSELLVHQLIDEQASATPNAIAIKNNGREISYLDLKKFSDRLAKHLLSFGVTLEDRIGICLDRSADYILCILGILKSGCVFVPVDPKLPKERVGFQLSDSNIKILITNNEFADRFSEFDGRLIVDYKWGESDDEADSYELPQLSGENAAYIIYTSGSTGDPKGVVIEHQSLSFHVQSIAELNEIKENTRVLQIISYSFDASGEEIYPTLVCGGTLVQAPDDIELSGEGILGFCQKESIETMVLPVAVWHRIVADIKEFSIDIPTTIRCLIVGGEAPSAEGLEIWSKASRHSMSFINAYGPTEATIGSTYYKITNVEKLNLLYDGIPIGTPLPQIDVKVVNKMGKTVPLGIPGELLIGGIGLARGYQNLPELTNDRFIYWENGKRYYKTGDQVVMMPDGNLYFMGRFDKQVKWRGYRIELGEIEELIRKLEGVKDTIVILRDDHLNDKRLVAYLVTNNNMGMINNQEIKQQLRQRLPEYMVPSHFVQIKEVPLTNSGKINYRGLPAPFEENPEISDRYLAPRNAIEQILVGLFENVLGTGHVGIHDDFFSLGGHSLTATQLVSRIRSTFGIELSIKEFFNSPTVIHIAALIQKYKKRDDLVLSQPIKPVNRESDIPLSYSQQRLWFIDQLEPGNLFYNLPIGVKIQGLFSVEILNKCVHQIIQRHEVFRTSFHNKDGNPIQRIQAEPGIAIQYYELTDLPEEERDKRFRDLAEQEIRKPFQLENGSLLRIAIYKVDEMTHLVLFVFHHIISDGWSLNLFIRELATLYVSFRDNLPNPLEELQIQYVDYAAWQHEWLSGDVLQKQLEYWEEKLAGIPPLLDIPTDKPRPAIKTSNGEIIAFSITGDLSSSINSICRKEGVTAYMFFLAAFQTLLYRYSGQEDICLGTAIANRTRPEFENIIGMFVNTLVMRTSLEGNPSFRELLEQVRATTLEAYDHQDLPFEMLVDKLQPTRNLSYTPIFQVGFDFQTNETSDIVFPGLMIHSIELAGRSAVYDLFLSISTSDDGYHGSLEYNCDLFFRETIEHMIDHLKVLLGGIVESPETTISRLPLLTEAERQILLYDWNQTDLDTHYEDCIHRRFENIAGNYPNHTALTYESKNVTYSELNGSANKVARHLRTKGIAEDTVVGIYASRSIEMIIGILGVLKAGGAYLPLDPNYPKERLSFMMEDTARQQPDKKFIILTLGKFEAQLTENPYEFICLDKDWDLFSKEEDSNLDLQVLPENLAYVIFTSGSTGMPKGTLLSHRGLCNLVEVQRNAFDITCDSRILQFSPLSFDASVWEIFMALGNGGTLCLASQEILSSGIDLISFMKEERISIVTLPPSLLSVMPVENLPELKTIISAGEACSKEIVDKWAVGRKFFNAYGPTETTVCASMGLCQENSPEVPSIGRPISNFKVYIVEKNMQLVPIGVPGELLIGGIGLARGYLNRKELTEEKFIPNPFIPGKRLYRTGDLVRYRKNGDIEYLGRIDQQVKVRGFRIELGEVENVLRGVSIIQDAVVAVRPGRGDASDVRIIAYIILKDNSQQDPNGQTDLIRNHLKSKLPDYMIPSHYIFMENFPVTTSGKIDKKSLPGYYEGPDYISRKYVAPRNEVEEKLTSICSSLLGLDRVGVSDNFFELGGHSLLATRFISRIRDVFLVELPLRLLFEHPTIGELAMEIEILQKKPQSEISQTIQPAPREKRRIRRSDLEE